MAILTRPLRLGAVSYLNVRPLVYGLDAIPGASLRFDVPAECARLLAAGEIDLGMAPSITYADRPGDKVVPGLCIGSDGPVASVALFARRPLREIRTIALDTSSRTSAALVRILCARRFGISPSFAPHAPDLAAMLATSDAALLIGDAALFADLPRVGTDPVGKIDLGAEWTDMTGLPFVWAFWTGRPTAVGRDGIRLLQRAAAEGRSAIDDIAATYCMGDISRTNLARRYLRENLTFDLSARAIEGVGAFFREAHALGLATHAAPLAFFDGGEV